MGGQGECVRRTQTMKTPALSFLGWDRPAVELVADRLLAMNQEDPDAFRRATVVVPTAESGRCLRECLAERAGKPIIVPHFCLMGQLISRAHEPSEVEMASVWMSVVDRVNGQGRWPHLFPQESGDREGEELEPGVLREWLVSDVMDLMQLRARMEVAGVSPEAVMECLERNSGRYGDVLETERERWHEVAEAFALVDAEVRKLGWFSSKESYASAWERMRDPAKERHAVILACVPQVSPMMRRYLLDLGGAGYPIEVWVNAPWEQRRHFDAFGCPQDMADDPEAWSRRAIDLPEDSIHVVAGAGDMAECVVSLLEGVENRDVALGVCDARYGPAVATALGKAGWGVFLPQGRMMAASEAGQLPSLLGKVVSAYTADAADFILLLRNEAMQRAYGLFGKEQEEMGALLDRIEQEDFPERADTLMEILRRRKSPEALLQYAHGIRSMVQRLGDRAAFPEALEELASRLGMVGESFSSPGEPSLIRVSCLMQDLARCLTGGHPLRDDPRAAFSLLHALLADARTESSDRGHTHLDALGWMELPYARGHYMLLAGLHDGCVPETAALDPYLPDSLRALLGMDCVRQRVIRDSYLLTSLLHSHPGTLHVAVARQDDAGSPVSASRLLIRFREGEEERLAVRVKHLFEHPEPMRHPLQYERGGWYAGRHLASLPRDLQHERVSMLFPDAKNPWAEGRAFSPSVIKSFLADPLAFWIRKLAGMDPHDAFLEGKSSMDALDYGTCFHRVLQCFVTQFPRMRQGLDADVLQRACCRILDEEFKTCPTLSMRIQRELMERKMEQFARCHLADLEQGWCTDPGTGLEVDVSQWKLDGEIPFRFRVDRIDRNERTGEIRLIDYKTGATEPGEAHLEKLSPVMLERYRLLLPQMVPWEEEGVCYRWKDVQLPLYCRYLQETFPGAPIRLGYYLLPKGKEMVRFSEWKLSPGQEESALSWCREAACLIRQGKCLLSAASLGAGSESIFGNLDPERDARAMFPLQPLP